MFSKRVVLGLVCLCCLIVALVPSAAFAQSASTGTVTGVVKDSTGAAVAGASVTLTDTATKDTRTTTANDVGTYFFANVAPGTYNVAIKKAGFRVAQFSNQVVTVGLALTLNATLEVGSATQVIEVTTTGAELQTLNSTVGNSVDRNALDKLPTIGRDANTFLTLQPGVAIDGSVAGTVVDQSTFLLDGGQNTNDMDGSMNVYTNSLAGSPTGIVGGGPTGVMPTPIDSVEEFKVSTVNQTADFNSSAGAQVQFVTKKGTNAWHGSGYEYYLDNAWDANGWNRNNGGGTNALYPARYHYNRFGGSIGGPIIPKKILGGKTYFFANYEGYRFPQAATFYRTVPTASMKAGILTFVDQTTGAIDTFNMKTGTNCGSTGTAACDPRGIGINPEVSALWNKFEPAGNYASKLDKFGNTLLGCNGYGTTCDGLNEQTFQGQVLLGTNSNFGVARIDHDFSDKWHFNMTYHDYKFTTASTCQVDIGGFFSGDTLGNPKSTCSRPIQPWYITGSLTTNATANVTNDLHYSYLRNWWSWSTLNGPPQLAGLGGALEIFGESGNALIPYNVNTQSIRTRFWDGQDQYLRDDVTILHGKHLFTFGATYEYNWDWHQRSDNGGGINFTPTYQIGDSIGGGLVDFSSTLPAVSGLKSTTWARDSAAVLGIVTDSQVAFTRSGPTLTLNPPLTHAEDKSTIPYYNFYFSDSFRIHPTFTLTYGLGWTLEMPPTEAQGRQIELVDSSSQQLDVMSYLNTRKAQALLGQVYNPEVGFALVGNTGGGQKYPYDPFYGSFSPRVAGAWSPNFDSGILGKAIGSNKTVFRAGYSRIYGRLNGVDLVLVPLLGTGLIQPVQCRQNFMSGACGPTNPTVANAFRIGTDGLSAPLQTPQATLPQPTFPGYNSGAGSAGEALDPHFRPNVVDSFDFTIQRQISSKWLVEVGYIGRLINHEYQPININAVPYMMTLGGQQFAKAYAAVETGLGCATSYTACGANIPGTSAAAKTYANSFAPQPFFEAALAGTGYCTGFASCTAAVVYNEGFGTGNLVNQAVWSLWSDLDQGGIGGGPGGSTLPGFNFARSMLNSPINTSAFGASGQLTSGVGVNASVGFGNYHAGFATVKFSNWHGLSSQSTFTYSKALGTGAFVQATSEYTPNDSFNIGEMYGSQGFDREFVFNSFWVYDIPFYKSQKGLVGHILGGWSIAPIITIGSGGPDYCGTITNAQSYGSGDGANFFDNEQCHVTGNIIPNGEPTYIGSTACAPPACIFQTAAQQNASYNLVRPGILGLDTKDAGVGPIFGHGYWNIDAKLTRNIKVTERVSANFEVIFTNVFNHVVFQDPNLDVFNSGNDWGNIGGQANNPRAMQLGARISF